MTREQALKIGLALNHIGMVLDEATYKRCKPYLDEIEEICLKIREDCCENCKDAENKQG